MIIFIGINKIEHNYLLFWLILLSGHITYMQQVDQSQQDGMPRQDCKFILIFDDDLVKINIITGWKNVFKSILVLIVIVSDPN